MDAPRDNLTRSVPFELERAEGGDGLTLSGYAAVFDTPTRIDSWEGKFDEVIARGAFKKTISERMPVLQFDHGHDTRTGSVPIGAITSLREDRSGLRVEARLHDNELVKPIRDAIESGAISGMSFRFQVVRDTWDESGDIPLRTIKEAKVPELGPVVFPAYQSTSVGVRSILDGLTDAERAAIVAELRDLITPHPDAEGTSVTGAAPTSRAEETAEHVGLTFGERACALRSLDLEEILR